MEGTLSVDGPGVAETTDLTTAARATAIGAACARTKQTWQSALESGPAWPSATCHNPTRIPARTSRPVQRRPISTARSIDDIDRSRGTVTAIQPGLRGQFRQGSGARSTLKDRAEQDLPLWVGHPAGMAAGALLQLRRRVAVDHPTVMSGMGSEALQRRPNGQRLVALEESLSEISKKPHGLLVESEVQSLHGTYVSSVRRMGHSVNIYAIHTACARARTIEKLQQRLKPT